MTIETYRDYINRDALIRASGVDFQVRVLDVGTFFGNVRARITPIAGEGQSWIDFSRLQFVPVRGEVKL